MNKEQNQPTGHFYFLALGFITVNAQILFLRLFLARFYGNELTMGAFLGAWLIWTAAGSFAAGRIRSSRLLLPALLAFSLLIPLTSWLIILSANVLRSTPGEMVSTASILLAVLLDLLPFCLLAGALFALGLCFYTRNSSVRTGRAAGSFYLFETLGAALGGFVLSFFLLPSLNPLATILLISAGSLVATIVFIHYEMKPLRPRTTLPLLAVFFFFILYILDQTARQQEQYWQPYTLTETFHSRYGRLELIKSADNFTLYENGLKLTTVPDTRQAEELVHLSLPLHHKPARILLIGGGINGTLNEIFKYSDVERVDYVELDATLFRIARLYFPDEWNSALQDERLRVFTTDGRYFLNQSSESYDLILLSLPPPYTAQLNRFYTVEFFRLAARHLKPGGILSFTTTGAENYISEELAGYLLCLSQSLKKAFNCVDFIPGDPVHFLASADSLPAAHNPQSYLAGLKSNRIEPMYVRDFYIRDRLRPDRIAMLAEFLDHPAAARLNYDFNPVAYYYDAALWSGQFSKTTLAVFMLAHNMPYWLSTLLLAVIFTVLFLLIRPAGRTPSSAGLSMMVAGFSGMALEVVVLMAFQVLRGSLYYQLALLIAVFMSGMALGGWLAVRRTTAAGKSGQAGDVLFMHTAFGLLALLLVPLLRLLYGAGDLLLWQVFAGLTLLAGGLTGTGFPLLSRLYYEDRHDQPANTGGLYALDLAGAMTGAFVPALFLIPVYGYTKTALLLAAFNFCTVLISGLLLHRKQRR